MLYVSKKGSSIRSCVKDSFTGKEFYVRDEGTFPRDYSLGNYISYSGSATGDDFRYGEWYDMSRVLGYVEEVGTCVVPEQLLQLLDYIESIEIINNSPDNIPICRMGIQHTDVYNVFIVNDAREFCSIFDMLMRASYNKEFWGRLMSGILVFGFKDSCVKVSFCGDYESFIRNMLEMHRVGWRRSGMMRRSGLDIHDNRWGSLYVSAKDKSEITVTDVKTGKSFLVANDNEKFFRDGEPYSMTNVIGYIDNVGARVVSMELVHLLHYIDRIRYIPDRISTRYITNILPVCRGKVQYRGNGNVMLGIGDSRDSFSRYSILDLLMCASYNKSFQQSLDSGWLALSFRNGNECVVVVFRNNYKSYIVKLLTLYKDSWLREIGIADWSFRSGLLLP